MELFIQSIFVYGFIVLVMTNAGLYTYRHQYPNGFISENNPYNKKSSFIDLFTKSHFLIPLLVYCFFVTVREQVGVDCEGYKENFYSILHGKSIRESLEIGFREIINFSIIFTDKHYLMFLIMALAQIVPLYYSMRKEGHLLIFFGIAFILGGTMFSFMNGVRQNIATCVFVAATPLILNKKYWIFVIPAMLLALTMHRSAILIIPIAMLGYICRNFIPNRFIQLIILFICLIFMDKAENFVSMSFLELASYSGYKDSVIEHYSEYEIKEKSFGLRSIMLLLTYIIAILHSNKMKAFYNSKKFNYIYNLFFIGTCLFLLFYNYYVMNRILFYFMIFIPIVQSYLLFYLWYNKNRNKNNGIMFYACIIILLTHFTYQLYDSMQKIPNETTLYKFDL